jgi:hypothetical protein
MHWSTKRISINLAVDEPLSTCLGQNIQSQYVIKR